MAKSKKPELVRNLITAVYQYAIDGIDKPSVAPYIEVTFPSRIE